MKFSSSPIFLLLVSSLTTTDAFTPVLRQPTTCFNGALKTPRSTSSSPAGRLPPLRMSDFDFPSAMPEKPKQSLEEKMVESAENFIEMMGNALGEGVEAPPELESLKKAVENNASATDLALGIYELMIERGMLYDEAPETGILTPTEFNIKDNLDVKEVKDEFSYLYKYGMNMMNSGMLSREQLETCVVKRLIERTGLTPEKFDEWLGF